MMPKLLVFSTDMILFVILLYEFIYFNKIIVRITNIKARKTFQMKLEII